MHFKSLTPFRVFWDILGCLSLALDETFIESFQCMDCGQCHCSNQATPNTLSYFLNDNNDGVRKQYGVHRCMLLVFRQFAIVLKCGTTSTDSMSTRPIQYLSSYGCRQMANVGEFERQNGSQTQNHNLSKR